MDHHPQNVRFCFVLDGLPKIIKKRFAGFETTHKGVSPEFLRLFGRFLVCLFQFINGFFICFAGFFGSNQANQLLAAVYLALDGAGTRVVAVQTELVGLRLKARNGDLLDGLGKADVLAGCND